MVVKPEKFIEIYWHIIPRVIIWHKRNIRGSFRSHKIVLLSNDLSGVVTPPGPREQDIIQSVLKGVNSVCMRDQVRKLIPLVYHPLAEEIFPYLILGLGRGQDIQGTCSCPGLHSSVVPVWHHLEPSTVWHIIFPCHYFVYYDQVPPLPSLLQRITLTNHAESASHQHQRGTTHHPVWVGNFFGSDIFLGSEIFFGSEIFLGS